MKILKHTFAAAAFAIPFLAHGSNDILFEHEFGTPDGGWCTSCNGTYRVWDQFNLNADSLITSIEARLHLTPDMPNSIEFSIWDQNRNGKIYSATVPRELLPVTPVTSQQGMTWFDVSVSTSVLLAGGSYSLSVYAGEPTDYMGWGQAILRDGLSVQTDGGAGNGLDMMFAIHGVPSTVPEPATWGLAFSGVLVAMTASLRRRKAQQQASILA